jgi:hypothetical protein
MNSNFVWFIFPSSTALKFRFNRLTKESYISSFSFLNSIDPISICDWSIPIISTVTIFDKWSKSALVSLLIYREWRFSIGFMAGSRKEETHSTLRLSRLIFLKLHSFVWSLHIHSYYSWVSIWLNWHIVFSYNRIYLCKYLCIYIFSDFEFN